MGFMSPPRPSVDPELVKAREAEKERLAKEEAASEKRKADLQRKQRANLLGTRSLQSEEIGGFTGYRRRVMGGDSTPKSGSIRS
jgi:hypothetical protein